MLDANAAKYNFRNAGLWSAARAVPDAAGMSLSSRHIGDRVHQFRVFAQILPECHTGRVSKFSPKRSTLGNRARSGGGGRWENWGGNVTAEPSRWVRPRSEREIIDAVSAAAVSEQRVKAVGSGHSFTAVAKAPEVLVDLSEYVGVVAVDHDTKRVRVRSGTPLRQINRELDGSGLALANMGDIAYQTIAGAISTGTHGTGRSLGGIAPQVVGFRLVDGTGVVHNCVLDGENHDIAHHGRVGLGALGLLSEVTIQAVPSFSLHAVNEPMKVDKLLDNLDTLVDTNDHFEFFWVPHTKWALTKRNNRTAEPLRPRPKATSLINDYLLENAAFGAVCKLGQRAPSLIPRLATALPSSGVVDYVDRSFEVFASPRFVKFLEQEYSVPVAALPDALREVMAMVDRVGHKISFPVEVRFTPADDLALSTSTARASAYIAVHMTKGSPHERYFADVEAIMDRYQGRPHWGKIHTKNADQLAPLYPQWQDFLALRRRLDPAGRFTNEYLNRVLGPIAP